MSADWVIACRDEPVQERLVAAVAAVAGEAWVRDGAEGLLLEIASATAGSAAAADVAVELPRLVRVGAEPGRVLAGATVNELPGGLTGFPSLEPSSDPVWWIEIHATSAAGRPMAERLAVTMAHAFGGAVVGPPPGVPGTPPLGRSDPNRSDHGSDTDRAEGTA